MGDFNVALVIVAAVVLLVSVYLLLFVVLGLTVAVLSILILPADVANRQACRKAVYNGACDLTLPMRTLWLVVYIVDAVLAFLVIPFAMFYYEGDQDKSVGKRLRTAATPCGSTVSSMHINFWHCGKPFSIGPVDCSAPSSPVATALSPGGWLEWIHLHLVWEVNGGLRRVPTCVRSGHLHACQLGGGLDRRWLGLPLAIGSPRLPIRD
uniref:Uncharacterized protein n=1 Tax=Oryza meridionalis TaxID=40149 RepID=A0A0E0DKP3_9ORYZ